MSVAIGCLQTTMMRDVCICLLVISKKRIYGVQLKKFIKGKINVSSKTDEKKNKKDHAKNNNDGKTKKTMPKITTTERQRRPCHTFVQI